MPSVTTLPEESQQKPLRIVMIAHSHHLGGMERHVVTLSKTLSEHGHAIAYAGPMDGWLGEEMKAAGYPCCHAPINGMYDMVSVWRMAQFARGFKATLLHGHSQRGGRYADLVGWFLRLPAVATAHSTTSSKWFKRRIPVIAVANAVRDNLLSRGLSEHKVKVVHLGVQDVPQVTPPLSDLITPQRPIRLGMISRVEHVKGHDIALAALEMLKEKLPFEFSIVGADDTEWAHGMKVVAAQRGIAKQVKFLGQRNDIDQLLEQFDILLAPSRREALSLSLIEAAASARPAIASNVGGIPEILLHEKTGLLFPSENAGALAWSIEQLCHPEKRIAYGNAARQYYEREFTIDAMREKTQAVYHAAIAAR